MNIWLFSFLVTTGIFYVIGIMWLVVQGIAKSNFRNIIKPTGGPVSFVFGCLLAGATFIFCTLFAMVYVPVLTVLVILQATKKGLEKGR